MKNKMISNADIFHYLEWEATKIIKVKGDYTLLSSNIEFYDQVKKIDKAFVNEDVINDELIRIQIVIDDYKVIGTFNYKMY